MDIPRLLNKSFEWYTPAKYIQAVKEVMGDIDLDPASCEFANRTVQASSYYDLATDGLAQSWHAKTLFLNPPYCKVGNVSNQAIWTAKLISEYEAGNVKQAILLVNAAVETQWFYRLYDYPMCFVKGRIQFDSIEGVKKGSTVGSAFVYFGTNLERFITVFRRFGVIIQAMPFSEEAA